ncbi:hypothetical protein [Rubinisphaera italica]|uniref:Uncharacterized protein n=1 Tax=Rubinisphaera italica TaxID=2527969 RepID=A0A5C5XFX1_9PLAN|nr:hypothetical protein [Rubinisphaera italica]TWT61900.1 hypothetical protein Pan54_26370 [Rubinisphaera italica]
MSNSEEVTNSSAAGSGGRIALFVLILFLCYPLSPVPVIFLLEVSGIKEYSGVESIFSMIYAPLGYLIEKYDWIQAFYEWQIRTLYLVILNK